jgi:hypothetical protein
MDYKHSNVGIGYCKEHGEYFSKYGCEKCKHSQSPLDKVEVFFKGIIKGILQEFGVLANE